MMSRSSLSGREMGGCGVGDDARESLRRAALSLEMSVKHSPKIASFQRRKFCSGECCGCNRLAHIRVSREIAARDAS
jgi:hypothetical protein